MSFLDYAETATVTACNRPQRTSRKLEYRRLNPMFYRTTEPGNAAMRYCSLLASLQSRRPHGLNQAIGRRMRRSAFPLTTRSGPDRGSGLWIEPCQEHVENGWVHWIFVHQTDAGSLDPTDGSFD